MHTLPEVGWSRQPIICRRVVFPEPEGPTSAVNSPFSMERLTPRNACVWTFPIWYTRVMFSIFTTSMIFLLDLTPSFGHPFSHREGGGDGQLIIFCTQSCDRFHAGSHHGRV